MNQTQHPCRQRTDICDPVAGECMRCHAAQGEACRDTATGDEAGGLFFHATPKPDRCKHDFQGWRDLKNDDGQVCGGTTVCTKCGLDAMTYSLRCGP